MERIMLVASTAALMALILMRVGSQTKDLKQSQIEPSLLMSTPNHRPSSCVCFWRSMLSRSIESKPALMASWRGMTSSDLANALMRICCLPTMVRACSRR
eukprot:Amastigsp_a175365_241.p5 type:complete len:100 gc:universal Amastigsp_a175365_241:95-394(+)